MIEVRDIVGTTEIANRLNVNRLTVSKWHSRSRAGQMKYNPFPPPRWDLANGPLWDYKRDILPWWKKR